MGVIDGVRDGRGVSVGGPEGVGVSLAVAETEWVGVWVWVGGKVEVALGGNRVAVKVAVGVGVAVAVGAMEGRPENANPPVKPTATSTSPPRSQNTLRRMSPILHASGSLRKVTFGISLLGTVAFCAGRVSRSCEPATTWSFHPGAGGAPSRA